MKSASYLWKNYTLNKKNAQWQRTLTGIPDYIERGTNWRRGAAAVPTCHLCSKRHLLQGAELQFERKLALPINSTDSNKIRIKLGLLLEIYFLDFSALNFLENLEGFFTIIAIK